MDQLAYERALEKVIEADRVKQEKMMKKMKIASVALSIGTLGLLTAYDASKFDSNSPYARYMKAVFNAFRGRLSSNDARFMMETIFHPGAYRAAYY
jgi:hypothetical protein